MQKKRKEGRDSRSLCIYLLLSLLCFIFSGIYGCFSHGISSPWMTFLFAWPLLLGALPAALRLFLGYSGSRGEPGVSDSESTGTGPEGKRTGFPFSAAGEDLYGFGIAAVSVGSLLEGILEIAGTDSPYPGCLMLAGAAMLLAGILFYALYHLKR